ncbi:MAG: hypothetical protein F6K50_18425 [Moorea sp. SIO3I7]|uniref:Uncharacterized protein n=1 Tax=Moorena bouillonii PNG TaxID=568701 RepID=A0A1U7MVK1_9CYAN|nr:MULTISPECIES: hypothetical protein [Moorena]NEN97425.1 hypothetical protein [Moorena sp. SIO3I7]NEO50054.1 hypothetical protein [Moorena sp. SIO4A3]NEO59741.1 hypothetical protein [Moorena sp. SIO4G2]NEQ80530.1 hypothetical protein [Moorena sp. SIO2I5]NEO08219.1 hypothetical protein [Moorena sp. SIO3I8]
MNISELEYFELEATDHPILGGFAFTSAEAFAGPGFATINGDAHAFGQHTNTSVTGFTDVDPFFSQGNVRAHATSRDPFFSGNSRSDAFAIYGFIG